MKILNKVSEPPSYISRFKEIVGSKKSIRVKTVLNAILPLIELRYQKFQNELVNRNLHLIRQDNIMVANKTDLLSCYLNKSKKTLDIFDEIKNAQDDGVLNKCPYCGITRPGTFDHYLPESVYPEYSVHVINLVPCCSDCNSTKGERLASVGVRRFIHFYSDKLPEDQFLFVNIATSPNCVAFGVDFFLQQPNNFDSADWLLIASHFKELKLLSRYKNEANDEISSCFCASKSFLKNGGTNVQGFINDICDGEGQKLGNSHWRVVLKRQLALTQDFVTHVINEASRP